MTAPERKTHWKSLADQLGAPPTQENEATDQPAPADPPPPVVPQANVAPIAGPRQATIRQAKADWEALASVLGLSSKSVSPSETKASEPAADVSETRRTPAYEPPRSTYEPPRSTYEPPRSTYEPPRAPAYEPPHEYKESDSPASAELPPHIWSTPSDDLLEPADPLQMSTEPFVDEIVDAVELDVTIEIDSDAEVDSGDDERRRRRRRRRRRGRRPDEGSRPATSEAEVGPEPYEEPEADLAEPLQFADDDAESDVEREPRDADDEGSDEEGRPRRRRRRRRRGGRRDESPRASAPAAAADSHDDDPSDDDKTIADILGEDEHDEDEHGEPHLSHKKIPSWQEAIEVVVSNNIAQRSKHPSGGSRGRGRRDR